MIPAVRDIIAAVAFVTAIGFGVGGIVGLFRFPGAYARLQSGSLCGTTAVFSCFIGALALAPTPAVTARVIIIGIFFLFSAPTGSHIVARFAWNADVDIWHPPANRQWQLREGHRSLPKPARRKKS